jgi:hypothetical protein
LGHLLPEAFPGPINFTRGINIGNLLWEHTINVTVLQTCKRLLFMPRAIVDYPQAVGNNQRYESSSKKFALAHPQSDHRLEIMSLSS